MANNDFTYGLLTPGLALLASCAGFFLGLRCTARARSYAGTGGRRWFLLGGVSVGATGVWTMSFIAMLGYTVPGMTIHYNVLVTILSLVVAVAVACAGLLFVGVRRPRRWMLLAAGLVTGIGLGLIHYLFMAAMRMPGRVAYEAPTLIGSFALAVAVATALLWAATRLDRIAATLAASVVIGIAVTGMHFVGMAGMEMYQSSGPMGMVVGSGGGPSADGFVVPLIIGVLLVWWIMVAAIILSPTAEEIRYDQALLERIRASVESPAVQSRSVQHAVGSPAETPGGKEDITPRVIFAAQRDKQRYPVNEFLRPARRVGQEPAADAEAGQSRRPVLSVPPGATPLTPKGLFTLGSDPGRDGAHSAQLS